MDDADAKVWSMNLKPLADADRGRAISSSSPKQRIPIRNRRTPKTRRLGSRSRMTMPSRKWTKTRCRLINERAAAYFAGDADRSGLVEQASRFLLAELTGRPT